MLLLLPRLFSPEYVILTRDGPRRSINKHILRDSSSASVGTGGGGGEEGRDVVCRFDAAAKFRGLHSYSRFRPGRNMPQYPRDGKREEVKKVEGTMKRGGGVGANPTNPHS